ncbi:MAG: type II/IV secretion system protein [Armatimonadetes bacterium]|nr:type II/IV secretion system protein [Armatimonadota bacterium]
MSLKSKIPFEFFQRHLLLPMEEREHSVAVGICPDSRKEALEDLRLMIEKDIEPVSLQRAELEEGLRNYLTEALGKEKEEEEPTVVLSEGSEDLLGNTEDAPIVRIVNSFILKALGNRASDIHLEPLENEAIVRMRVDGMLHASTTIPLSRYRSVVSRLKVMGKLDTSESRLPQDGRIRVKAGGKVVDVRMSTVPTLFGERVVLRLLDLTASLLTLPELGLLPDSHSLFKKLIEHPYGMILVTGPTGSGKTTSLYAVLQELRSPFANIISIEDPVEYQVSGVGQIPVNPRIGLTFAAGLRSILRQDPDIIMVGEIRDGETAEIGIHAALTGHLVISTLHTQDAPTAISRLLDLGVEGYLISSSLIGVIAQRLVRKLCNSCKVPYVPTEEEKRILGLSPEDPGKGIFQPVGCDLCLSTGYLGRVAIFEIMEITEPLRSAVLRSGEAAALRKISREEGLVPLFEDGIRKVLAGMTTIGEILRATRV